MPELIAYRYEINSRLKHPDCAGMSQQVRPDSLWKSRVGAMQRCGVVSEDVVNAVSSESPTPKVPEHGLFEIDWRGR